MDMEDIIMQRLVYHVSPQCGKTTNEYLQALHPKPTNNNNDNCKTFIQKHMSKFNFMFNW